LEAKGVKAHLTVGAHHRKKNQVDSRQVGGRQKKWESGNLSARIHHKLQFRPVRDKRHQDNQTHTPQHRSGRTCCSGPGGWGSKCYKVHNGRSPCPWNKGQVKEEATTLPGWVVSGTGGGQKPQEKELSGRRTEEGVHRDEA